MRKATFWHDDNETCLFQVKAIYERSGLGETLRHYYYKLLSSGAIRLLPVDASSEQAYKWLSRILVDARERELLPWSAIIDTGRRSFRHWSYSSLESYAHAEAHSGYKLDPWRGQKKRIEVWVEKDAMANQIYQVVEPMRIPVYVAKGYSSATLKNDTRKRYGDGSGWILLYCGDFDPTGVDIERELQATLAEYGARPVVERVTLKYEETLSLPAFAALDLKERDARTPAFRAKYPGSKGYEMDVLSTDEIQDRLLRSIGRYFDQEAFDAAIKLEEIIRREASLRLEAAMEDFSEAILSLGAPGCSLSLAEQQRYLLEAEGEEEDLSF
jgi:hypothetical protein